MSEEVKKNGHQCQGVLDFYKDKYPGGQVYASENEIDVYDADGNHCVAKRKNGAGQWVCVSEEMGCKDKHDMSA